MARLVDGPPQRNWREAFKCWLAARLGRGSHVFHGLSWVVGPTSAGLLYGGGLYCAYCGKPYDVDSRTATTLTAPAVRV